MNDFAAVQVDEPINKLGDEILGFILGQPLSFFKDVVEGVVAAELQQNVYIVVILKNMIEADHSPMLQSFVNFNFSDKLLNRCITFCFAFAFFKFSLFTILMAETFLVSIQVTSKHLANPPLPRSLPLVYFLTAQPLFLWGRRSSIIDDSYVCLVISSCSYFFSRMSVIFE